MSTPHVGSQDPDGTSRHNGIACLMLEAPLLQSKAVYVHRAL